MKKNTILLSLCILFLASCSLLDTEPQDFVTPSNYYNNETEMNTALNGVYACLLYTSPSPRDLSTSRMPSSA